MMFYYIKTVINLQAVQNIHNKINYFFNLNLGCWFLDFLRFRNCTDFFIALKIYLLFVYRNLQYSSFEYVFLDWP